IHFLLCFNRQGKIRLSKFYSTFTHAERNKVTREVSNLVLSRSPKHCNFILWKEYTVVYQRYASLFFVFVTDNKDNELITIEAIHKFVILLDMVFENICELDLIYEFQKAYMILDEFLLAGEQQDSSNKEILKAINEADNLEKSLLVSEALDEHFL
ncbi:hypothetical protein DICPUDRAFT_28313, partial [Dictyostelium purpureum]